MGPPLRLPALTSPGLWDAGAPELARHRGEIGSFHLLALRGWRNGKWGRMGEELGGGPGVGGNANRLGCPSHCSEVGAIEGMEQRRDRT